MYPKTRRGDKRPRERYFVYASRDARVPTFLRMNSGKVGTTKYKPRTMGSVRVVTDPPR